MTAALVVKGKIRPAPQESEEDRPGETREERAAVPVLVSVHERLIGLLVDGASQVLRVPVSSIEAAPDEVVEIDTNFIRGVAKLEKRLIILIDLSRILARELGEAEITAEAR